MSRLASALPSVTALEERGHTKVGLTPRDRARLERTSGGLLSKLWRLLKGDSEGHPFRGNQWTSGEGGGTAYEGRAGSTSLLVGGRMTDQQRAEAASGVRTTDAALWLSGAGVGVADLESRMTEAVQQHGTEAPTLYRGTTVEHMEPDVAQVILGLKPGDTISFEAASFTQREDITIDFALELSDQDEAVYFELAKGASAIDMEPHAAIYSQGAFSYQAEWVTAGTFNVTDWFRDEDGVHIGLSQSSTDLMGRTDLAGRM